MVKKRNTDTDIEPVGLISRTRSIVSLLWIACFAGIQLTSSIAWAQNQSGSQSAVAETRAGRSESEVLETPTGKLYGTLELPETKPPFPVALVISGSGPTDRNGNSAVLPGANNSLKLLAQGLAAAGIASLRFDKRGIGESAAAITKESDLRFDTYIFDAVLWGKRLREDKHFSTLTVIGHSEGALIGAVAAQGLKADGYVSIAGAGSPAYKIIEEQLKGKLPADLQVQSETILQNLIAGRTTEEVPGQLSALYRPSVQPYLISWFQYDPAKEIAKLAMPVLIIQGTTDIQISVDDAKLLAKSDPNAKLLIVDGMNHVLKEVPRETEKQISSYSDSSLPIAPELLTSLISFIESIQK